MAHEFLNRWLTPLLAVPAGYIVGLFFERVVLRRLEALSARTEWKGDDVIVDSLRGVTVILCTAAGLYVSLIHLPLRPALQSLLVKALQAVVILSATSAAAGMASGFCTVYASRFEEGLRHTSILTNVVRLVMFLLGGLIVLQTLGISVAPILTALGVGGLAVALALQDTLSNLFAGFHVIVSKQVRPGDYVRLDTADEGCVVDIGWRFTSIRTLANNMVIVPNAKLAGAIVTNYDQPDKELPVLVAGRAGFAEDLDRVTRTCVETGREVMKGVAGGVPSFEPLVRFNSFGEHGVEFNVILRCQQFADQYLVRHEFIRRLQERWRKEGIDVPMAARTVRIKEGGR